MTSQALEQMLDNTFVPNIAQDRVYQTIDVYINRTIQLYSFDLPKPVDQPKIIPSYNGAVIPHPTIPEVPDLHDTYKIDRYGNLYDGHTTINLPNDGKIRIDHDK